MTKTQKNDAYDASTVEGVASRLAEAAGALTAIHDADLRVELDALYSDLRAKAEQLLAARLQLIERSALEDQFAPEPEAVEILASQPEGL